jgi:antitoxin YefM
MDTLSYTNVRADLARTMDRVNDDRAPIVITRQRGRSAVLMSLEDYNSLTETMHLLRSPRNAARLAESMAQANKGRSRKRALIR